MPPEPRSRDVILQRLRRVTGAVRPQAPFLPRPVMRLAGESQSLAQQFGENLAAVNGGYELLDRRDAVTARVMQLVTQWNDETAERTVLSWSADELPVPGLSQTLERSGVTVCAPIDDHDGDIRARAARATVGLTGVDAAIATTGTVILASGPGKARVASLLPLRHIVLVPTSKIYPTVEAWVRERRAANSLRTLLSESKQVVFVTGPSKSADIELTLTLGVHGPRAVHALIFDDGSPR